MSTKRETEKARAQAKKMHRQGYHVVEIQKEVGKWYKSNRTQKPLSTAGIYNLIRTKNAKTHATEKPKFVRKKVGLITEDKLEMASMILTLDTDDELKWKMIKKIAGVI